MNPSQGGEGEHWERKITMCLIQGDEKITAPRTWQLVSHQENGVQQR